MKHQLEKPGFIRRMRAAAFAVLFCVLTPLQAGTDGGKTTPPGKWSEPVELLKVDRAKVVTVVPYGVFRDGKNLYVVFLNILRAGNRLDLTIRRSVDNGKTWQPSFSYALYSVDRLSNLVMDDGRLRGVAVTRARELQFLSVDVRDDFYKVTPIKAKGGLPDINPNVHPAFLIHNQRMYFLFADRSDARTSGLHLLESSDDGAGWVRRAGPPARHRGFRDGRLVLFASRALVHALFSSQEKGEVFSRVAHYVRYDRADKWYPRGRFAAPGSRSAAFAFGGAFDGENTLLLLGKGAPGGRSYELYSSVSRDTGSNWSDPTSTGAPIFKVFNEFTRLTAAGGRFALFGTRFDAKKDGAPAIAITNGDGEDWRDLGFGNDDKSMNFMVTGLLSADGRSVHVAYANAVGDPETGELRIMFRSWSDK